MIFHPRLLILLLLPFQLLGREQWDMAHAGNPILPGYYADPSLLQANGKYYIYATLDPWGGQTLGCWESPDFKTWTFRELNWPTKAACTSPTSREAMVWAPSVVRAPNGKFYMYVSVGSEIWAGVADHPLGPWHDAHGGTPVIPGDYKPGYHMIDAEVFVDDTGASYLYWGSGWEWKNGHCFAVKLKPDMISFDGEPRDITPGNYFEGPFMSKHGGHYYLSYSQGITIRDTYEVHYAMGDSPLGPFVEASNSPMLVTDKARNVVSPGHHALFNRDGHTYILYHRQSVPYVADQAYRQVCVDEVSFLSDGLMAKVIPTHGGPAMIRGREESGDRALEATVTASSELDALHGPSRCRDDNYATWWIAKPGDENNWLQLDFGAVRRITGTEIRFEYAWKIYHYALEGSADGKRWTMLADYRDKGNRGSPQDISTTINCRYLKLVFTPAKDETASLFEWSVH
ncbi:MAG TPA: family 43 glycosylhydrolase [Lacunisphaera sp.]|jgi:hypothetical protein